MTYEEVIEQLQDEKEEIEGSGFGNCSVESFDIAIEALAVAEECIKKVMREEKVDK